MPASNDFERIFNLCMSKGGTIHLRHSIQYRERKVWKITASVYQSGKQKLNIDGELVHNDFAVGLLECIVKNYSSKLEKA